MTDHTALTAGTVVRWHTSRTAGLGQVESIVDGAVHVRAWLPTRSRQVVTRPEMCTPLPDLTEAVTSATAIARRIADGLR